MALITQLHVWLKKKKKISGKRVNFIGWAQEYTEAVKISLLMLSLEAVNKHICTRVALCMCVCVCTHLLVTPSKIKDKFTTSEYKFGRSATSMKKLITA